MTAETPSSNAPPPPPSYKDTLNLPKTSFDMKANLVQREPAMLKQWEGASGQDLYNQIRVARKSAAGGTVVPNKGKWVLHDGPPYANGDIHMGHLINKVLKDIVVKFRTMQGYDSPYVPGWDCHGLPIESAIQKELGPKVRELSREEFRKRCHEYAMKFVGLQAEGFKRLGVFGDYERPYLTLDPKYEGGILDVLAELVQRDLVYRQKKPVHWCTVDRTALAEAELEYAERRDHSIYVAFQLVPNNFFTQQNVPVDGIELLIWTTTPWTLPANRAVAVHPKNSYCIVSYRDKSDKHHDVLVAQKLVNTVMHTAGVSKYAVSPPMRGEALVGAHLQYRHPLDPARLQPVVLAEYVTLEDGTGLVHTAPGHGAEDYQTGKRNNLEIYNPVLPDGKYDDTVPDFLKGQSIWEANRLVIDHLKAAGTLFHHEEFTHSYPHCWRCKKPTIFRATEQWFVRASGAEANRAAGGNPRPTGALREGGVEQGTESSGRGFPPAAQLPPAALWANAKRFVNEVQWVPTWGKNRIDGMLDTRPDWCISRQRSWGVPIPAFFDEKGNVLLTEKSVRRVADYFRTHGADSWYTDAPARILGDSWIDTVITPDGRALTNYQLPVNQLTKGTDILDVWFESGASHHAVLECTNPELGYPAAMYLEGSDQHRGWFQSSLLEAAGYKSEPPFKQVLTHGFVVDEKGRKMSKSEGNDIKVADALKRYGADILRLWVSSVDYQNDIPCGWNLFDRTGDAYKKIRNTIRYLLGNLYDFDPAKDAVEPQPHSIDRWMDGRSSAMAAEVYAAYDTYEFHKVFRTLYEFCNVEISAIYAKAIKDRMYCELPDSPRRRASQTVCHRALVSLIELSAPVLVFTAEEAWSALRQLPGGGNLAASVHLHTLPTQDSGLSTQDSAWEILLPLIDKGNKQLDDLKRSIGLGNPLDSEAVIILPKVEDDVSKHIADYGPEIEDALGCGFHRIERGEVWDIKINDTRELYPSCARSWKRRPNVGSDPDFPDLSARDARVVRALRAT